MTNLEQFQQRVRQEAENSVYAEKILVFGEGKLSPKIAMIGEAPGGDEEKQGHPFVGKAGKNLSEFLEIVGLTRDELFISNVVKLRPIQLSPKTGKPVNRAPSKAEIAYFFPILQEELAIASPEMLVTLGNVPLKALMEDESASIGDCHGQVLKTPSGQTLFPLYHPASMIYNPSIKKVYLEDLEKLKTLINE